MEFLGKAELFHHHKALIFHKLAENHSCLYVLALESYFHIFQILGVLLTPPMNGFFIFLNCPLGH